ncbi:MAG: hypothetical protein M3N10_02725 [Actinomycetota bacterium]|nr:hypothetical protein [Actinomycetota bacterium]
MVRTSPRFWDLGKSMAAYWSWSASFWSMAQGGMRFWLERRTIRSR